MNDYRSEVECLRAENARLTDRVAELEAKPKVEKAPQRWGIVPEVNAHDSDSGFTLGIMVVMAAAYVIVAAILFVGWAHIPMTSGIEHRGGLVFALAALAWCLAFVRRVPQ